MFTATIQDSRNGEVNVELKYGLLQIRQWSYDDQSDSNKWKNISLEASKENIKLLIDILNFYQNQV